jgi:hypothetical protein
MPACECSCGAATQGGSFLPGHDQTLRARLEAHVGGLLSMRELVSVMERYAAGKASTEELEAAVRVALAKGRSLRRP